MVVLRDLLRVGFAGDLEVDLVALVEVVALDPQLLLFGFCGVD